VRRDNELFAGAEYLTLHGRTIKHPSLIKTYASINLNKLKDTRLNLMGLDLETDSQTGELKLLGFNYEGHYRKYYKESFVSVIYNNIRFCLHKNAHIAYWNRLDPFILAKQLLQMLSPQDVEYSLARWGKRGGEWDRKRGEWIEPPVVEIQVLPDTYFGIVQVINSSIQFFVRRTHSTQLKRVWAFDIKPLYEKSLEVEAAKRLPYYTKVDKSAHVVDWDRYEKDPEYQTNIVDLSNEYDSRAAVDLAYAILDDFHDAFTFYPATLLSLGTLGRTAILAVLTTHHVNLLSKERPGVSPTDAAFVGAVKDRVAQDIGAIGILGVYDEWVDKYGSDIVKDLYSLAVENYSAGYIEGVSFGRAPAGWFVDLGGAYPAESLELKDLRGSTITKGSGPPPPASADTYCFIRGTVHIPYDVNFHSITVKHPADDQTNIRATGTYRAAYMTEDRAPLVAQGATFTDETWYLITTTGKPSPVAMVTQTFISLRDKLTSLGKSSAYMAKISANAVIGLLYEAIPTYHETEKTVVNYEKVSDTKSLIAPYKRNVNLTDSTPELKYHLGDNISVVKSMWHNPRSKITPEDLKDELTEQGIHINEDHPAMIILAVDRLYRQGDKVASHQFKRLEVTNAGYRAGEHWNPFTAGTVTARVRQKVARAATHITAQGGQVVSLMTDAVYYVGTADMVPADMVRPVKTPGYFEPPTPLKNLVSLGAGRYSYQDAKGNWQTKKRGFSSAELHREDGVVINEFNWSDVLNMMAEQRTTKLKLKVKMLISPGIIKHNHSYDLEDLGRIVEVDREVEAVVGLNKRIIPEKQRNAAYLNQHMVMSQPLYLDTGMTGGPDVIDQTLPGLRELLKNKTAKSKHHNRKKSNGAARKRYYEKKKAAIRAEYQNKYSQLKAHGYTPEECHHMASWGIETIQSKLEKDGKI